MYFVEYARADGGVPIGKIKSRLTPIAEATTKFVIFKFNKAARDIVIGIKTEDAAVLLIKLEN